MAAFSDATEKASDGRRAVRDPSPRRSERHRHELRQADRRRDLRVQVGPGRDADSHSERQETKARAEGPCKDPPPRLLPRTREQDRPATRRLRQGQATKPPPPAGADPTREGATQGLAGASNPSTERPVQDEALTLWVILHII